MNSVMGNQLENLLDFDSFSMITGLDSDEKFIDRTGKINLCEICVIAISLHVTVPIDPF
jgi:hypothetical protein